jgi:ketosteroid isomerase-like protein
MDPAEQVVEANLKFYFALESLDIDLMDEVWATDASAVCIYPGWSLLVGWENVRACWEQIFRNSSFMRVDVSEVSVEVQGAMAWVTCLENITISVGDQMRRYATNIFTFDDDRWLLVLHHASLVANPNE